MIAPELCSKQPKELPLLFAHHFTGVVAALFLTETLADLDSSCCWLVPLVLACGVSVQRPALVTQLLITAKSGKDV